MCSNMTTMRDVFWNRIYERAKNDRDIIVLSADFAAPSLDKFRMDMPAQFINLGISEQNMMLVAAGMALEGKKPFCYAIAPFITLRCFEQTKLYASGMDLPVVLVGVGAGVAYADSGYTHHAVEDIAILRTLPHMRIFQPCDNATLESLTDFALESSSPVYFRLDRYGRDNLIGDTSYVKTGLSVLRPVQKVTLLASGNMVMTALAAADLLAERGITAGVVDACIFPLDKGRFRKVFKTAEKIYTLEEHTLPGGIGSHVLEMVSDLDIPLRVKRFGMDLSDGYPVEYGGRELLQKQYGIDASSIAACILEECRWSGLIFC